MCALPRTVVYGSPAYLARLKAINPRLRLLAPLGSAAALEALANELKPYAVDARWEILSRDRVSRCHALGIQVFSDALGQHEQIMEYQKAMELGVDLIQTDHPQRLMRAVELRMSGKSSAGAPPARRTKQYTGNEGNRGAPGPAAAQFLDEKLISLRGLGDDWKSPSPERVDPISWV
jgi:hypothetical protein